ncbi:hypothetical protein [Chloroflexus sp.]|uniref:hypothetical protein n=1 Tax=Chloroflexus sp. TaxID=1904827 RepID=UPI002ADD4E25|nr:hypothetical protein [Chloroflexus sp.]
MLPILRRELGAHAAGAHGTDPIPARASYARARRIVVPSFGLGSAFFISGCACLNIAAGTARLPALAVAPR